MPEGGAFHTIDRIRLLSGFLYHRTDTNALGSAEGVFEAGETRRRTIARTAKHP